MFSSKPCTEARSPRRLRSPRVEVLEDRLQPGSVLPGLGVSLLGSSLPDLDAGLFAPQKDARQLIHDRPDSGQELKQSVDVAPAIIVTASQGRLVHAASAETAGTRDSSHSSVPPLTGDLLALSAASVQLKSGAVSGQHTSGRPAAVPAAIPATSQSGQLTTGTTRPSPLAIGQAQGMPQLVATAIPLPSTAFHPMHFSAVSPSSPNGEGGINVQANTNWATYVTGTTGSAAGGGVAVDGSGNIYVTGYIDDGGNRMAFVAKYDTTGAQAAQPFTFQAQDPNANYGRTEGHAIALGGGGSVYVTGQATDLMGGDTDAFIVKLDFSQPDMPAIVYGAAIGGPFNDSGDGIAVNDAGEATITGSYKPTASETDAFVAKYDQTGTITFANPYRFTAADGSTYDGSSGKAIALDATGNAAYVAGSILPKNGDNDILVFKVDNTTTGNALWDHPLTTSNPGDDTLNGVVVNTATGHVYVAGTFATADGGTNAVVAQVSGDGTAFVYQNVIQGTLTGTGLTVDSSDTVYMVGSAADANFNVHALVQQVDPQGTAGDSLLISGSATESGFGITYYGSGVSYVVGTTTSNDLATDMSMLNGTSDAFLASVGSFG